ncbi:MAG: DUF6152 family protein [Rhodospirillaceae bacterium]|nr:DUF6152 family protein [Rhodospirillaceae bacterium]
MCNSRSIPWLNAVAFTMMAGVSLAHHGFTNHFDPDQERMISGPVAEFRFVNPHILIYIDVESDGVVQRWKVEMGGISSLLSSGRLSHDSLQPGDQVEVVGHPSRHTDFELRASRVTLPDGREITMRNPYGPVPFLQQREAN